MHYILLIAVKTMHRAGQRKGREREKKRERKRKRKKVSKLAGQACR